MKSLGQLMKYYESFETDRKVLPTLPIYVRLDGRAFHTFTRNFERPYDDRMIAAMVKTTEYLIGETHAKIGYCQSDEISLIYYNENEEEFPLFGGSIFKLTSVLAGMASSRFTAYGASEFPLETYHMYPHFDCRVVVFPTKQLCVKMLYWRYRDAVKNSVSMLSQCVFLNKELHKKNTQERLRMLNLAGVDWEDNPSHFKYGTFLRRETIPMMLSEHELNKIPEKHRPTEPVLRSIIQKIDLSNFKNVVNIERVIFDGENPIVEESDAGFSEKSSV
jgi:tRNA(His) guanylyltransferase